METPEQRRERLARIIDPDLPRLPRIRLYKQRFDEAYELADDIIASDEAAGLVVVPVGEIERLRLESKALRDQFRGGNKYDAAAKEQD